MHDLIGIMFLIDLHPEHTQGGLSIIIYAAPCTGRGSELKGPGGQEEMGEEEEKG